MTIDAETIARIDATLLPQLDRHHLRLLAHCLASFRMMAPDLNGALPNAAQRRQWCEQQPVVADDPQFFNLASQPAQQRSGPARGNGRRLQQSTP